MAPSTPRLRILSVGGNAVSAFLSWRLSATNACDVTLVWKNGYDAVSQYGISFRSDKFGNERFKPRHVVRTPEEAAGLSRASYDYVVLCIKALPDVYDLASVIESVVAPQHTCILVNTTHNLGIESYLEQRFPTNVVLSLVSGAEIAQTGASEFEHEGATELWVGAANKNPSIPASIQQDMAEALAMTLKSGAVECEVSPNIRQQQYERVIGPIAFHPTSVVFETPTHTELLEKVGVRSLVTGVIDELLSLAAVQGCNFRPGFREYVMEQMLATTEAHSTMYQDFLARRPMEIETYLGSPIKLAQEAGVSVPRIETLYSLLHNANIMNQNRPQQQPVMEGAPPQQQRMFSAPPPRGYPPQGPMPPQMRNGMRPGPRSRAPSAQGGPPPPGARRGPPPMNGYGPPMNGNGYGPRGPPPAAMQRRPSLDNGDLPAEEFSHLMLYDNIPEGALADGGYDTMTPSASSGDLTLRERELMLRQKEMALREQEFGMRRRGPRMPPPASHAGYDDDDEDGEDFFDPAMAPAGPPIDAENFDMMSVTSRRTRKAPSASQLRNNPEGMGPGGAPRNSRGYRRPPPKNRASTTMVSQMPNLREELMSNPLMGYSSDRYGNVDRHNMGQESRTNSLTAERLHDMHARAPPGAYGTGVGPPMSRRGSHSPGNPLATNGRPPMGRPSPPDSYGPQQNGHGPMPPPKGPSPPGMRQPVPRYPPGHGNSVAPQHVEQTAGVSNLYPPKSGAQVRSLTGSASASAGSGDSNRSAVIDSSEPSAHSSSSSLGPRAQHAVGVR
nr:hypothetical protein B0A51_10083 [Rachicladosporium sp. CCFEE 5018]